MERKGWEEEGIKGRDRDGGKGFESIGKMKSQCRRNVMSFERWRKKVSSAEPIFAFRPVTLCVCLRLSVNLSLFVCTLEGKRLKLSKPRTAYWHTVQACKGQGHRATNFAAVKGQSHRIISCKLCKYSPWQTGTTWVCMSIRLLNPLTPHVTNWEPCIRGSAPHWRNPWFLFLTSDADERSDLFSRSLKRHYICNEFQAKSVQFAYPTFIRSHRLAKRM